MQALDLISYCGLTCIGCPIYWATKEENPLFKKRMLIKIAAFCNEKYSTHYTYNDIADCDGCKSESGKLFSGCVNCKIRSCAREKNCATCAHCKEFPCNELEKHFATEPGSRIKLEVIRSLIIG